ncbi:hypothetical protein ABPG77_007434 [Micractinium sp. CCAP 211/92]
MQHRRGLRSVQGGPPADSAAAVRLRAAELPTVHRWHHLHGLQGKGGSAAVAGSGALPGLRPSQLFGVQGRAAGCLPDLQERLCQDSCRAMPPKRAVRTAFPWCVSPLILVSCININQYQDARHPPYPNSVHRPLYYAMLVQSMPDLESIASRSKFTC